MEKTVFRIRFFTHLSVKAYDTREEAEVVASQFDDVFGIGNVEVVEQTVNPI